MSYGKARGRHRRIKRGDASEGLKVLRERERRIRDALAEHDALHQVDTDADDRFILMACEHPGKCPCPGDYPNGKPGQR